jgi:3-oxoadipate enol-lactonase
MSSCATPLPTVPHPRRLIPTDNSDSNKYRAPSVPNAALVRQVESTMQLPSGGRLTLAGNTGGPPILFLHGVGGAAWSWRPQVAEFGADYACFVWEARGHGDAPRVADAGLADYYTDAGEALAAVRASASAAITLVGHSMGGLLAVALGAQSPARVNGLVLIDPVYPQNDGVSAHDLGPLTPLMLGLMKPLVASFLNDGRVARAISRWMFTHSFTDRTRMEEAWRDQRRQVPIEYPKMFYEAFGRPEGFPVQPFARHIDVPVLVFNPRSRELVEALTQRLGARFVCERLAGGHYLQLDRPAEVNERLRRFLSEQIVT